MGKSDFLDGIILRKNGLVNMKIVFVDIVNFSSRKTKIQKDIIYKFTELTKAAVKVLSQKYVEYAQLNNLNFSSDLIIIPTGDGVLLSIVFEGLEKPHLDFSVELLRLINEHNNNNPCERFAGNHWCNCHSNFNVRIGIDEGQGIVFTDLNGNYNVAGNVINMASRIMNNGDENTILLGETAYKNIIDMAPDVSIEDDFRQYKQIRIKHDLFLDMYQYCPELIEFINSETPEDIQKYEQSVEVREIYNKVFQSTISDGTTPNIKDVIGCMTSILQVLNPLNQRELLINDKSDE